MKERNLQSVAAFFIPWLILFIAGISLSYFTHPSVKYFTYGFGITSIFTLIMLWWFGTGEVSNTATSALMSVMAISLKMFACAVIFIYYFHHNKKETEPAILTGSVIFLAFTTLEVYYGVRSSRRNAVE